MVPVTAVQGAVAELLTEVSSLPAGAGLCRAGPGVVAGTVRLTVLPSSVLTVALVQRCLLAPGVLLLTGLLSQASPLPSPPPLGTRAPQLLLTELKHRPARLGHQDLRYGAPVARQAPHQDPAELS